jgi:predicted nucleic acid-binding protein
VRVAEALLSTLREEPLTDPIVQAAIVLRRNYRIKVPDAIVAATANCQSARFASDDG